RDRGRLLSFQRLGDYPRRRAAREWTLYLGLFLFDYLLDAFSVPAVSPASIETAIRSDGKGLLLARRGCGSGRCDAADVPRSRGSDVDRVDHLALFRTARAFFIAAVCSGASD